MVILDLKWMEDISLLDWNQDTKEYIPKDDAPQYVKESYQHYVEQVEYYLKLERETGIRYL